MRNPQMHDIPSRYNPKDVEDKYYRFWEENNLFHAAQNPLKNPYSIVIPPPNITGILHMGHALNNTIQDILIRWRRMKGDACLWMPGTDHAGIATQNVVEKKLAKQGRKRQDLGREEFLKQVWKWRDEYGSTIIRQLKKLGASCDWQRTRFTMDEEYSEAVKAVFVALWHKGLIYQDNKVINWCPRCQTALSDEEAPYKDLPGQLYYIRYPLKNSSKHIIVATTRPETMLGDTAVAVNPKDKRYQQLVGETVILPLLEREIKIVADTFVDPEFGTGAVKVTPAHDPNDYAIGKRHKLDIINIMHPDGILNDNAGGYAAMERFAAREAIINDLKERNLLEKIESHQHSVGHCYRCSTVIEPYLSKQWFVKMKPLAKPAIAAVKKGQIKFHPPRWRKVYLNWMENIHDWCISRQIWWGHRIPIWYCLDCRKEAMASMEKPIACKACKSSNLKQDEDVLDTWFSSWLWPFATFYWPFKQTTDRKSLESDLDYFYPTSVLVTAPEIIFFWVARMIMAGFEFIGKKPFSDIYIHGTVRDAQGKKMSKSLGNIIDPLDIIHEFGCDALRFTIIYLASGGQDIFLSQEKFELGRNFANKIWNASRFALMNLESTDSTFSPTLPARFAARRAGRFEPSALSLSVVDQWILSRLNRVIDNVTKSLEKFRFNDAAGAIYEFFWHQFCDWYLELVKPGLNSDSEKPASPEVIFHVLETSLRLLHPFMPFITEELWQHLNKQAGTTNRNSIMISNWPVSDKKQIDKKTEQKMDFIIAMITAIRNIRSEMNVPQPKMIDVLVSTQSLAKTKMIKESISDITHLARLNSIEIKKEIKPRPKFSAAALVDNLEIFVLLEGAIDLNAEKERLTKKITHVNNNITRINHRLKNKDFINKAPKAIVAKEKSRQAELKLSLQKLKDILKGIT